MIEKIENTIKALNKAETKWAKEKNLLNEANYIYDCSKAQILKKTKEEWKTLEITNSDGREAYTTEKLAENLKTINEIKNRILEHEVEIKKLKRELNLYMTLLNVEVQ